MLRDVGGRGLLFLPTPPGVAVLLFNPSGSNNASSYAGGGEGVVGAAALLLLLLLTGDAGAEVLEPVLLALALRMTREATGVDGAVEEEEEVVVTPEEGGGDVGGVPVEAVVAVLPDWDSECGAGAGCAWTTEDGLGKGDCCLSRSS